MDYQASVAVHRRGTAPADPAPVAEAAPSRVEVDESGAASAEAEHFRHSLALPEGWPDRALFQPRGLVESAVIRSLDIAVAAVLLILTSPIMLALAIVIRLDSPGRAIFRQIRVGKDLRTFTFYKFRTLYADAKERFPELYRYEYSPAEIDTMRFKIEDDPRLTRVGRVLRKTSLDELPNLVNVLTGDLSLVGPRPEIPEMVRYYEPWQHAKWWVKPGVTGLAQVQGRGYLTLQETIYWDVKSVLDPSVSAYVKTLFRTLTTVLRGIGAY